MGCVHGRPTTSSPAPVATSSRRRDHPAVTQPQQEGVDSSDAAATVPPADAAAPDQQAAEKPEKVKRERRSRSSRSAAAAAAAAHAEVRLGGSFANKARGEQVAAGWPAWLSAVAGEAIDGWTPRRADSFEKIDKVRSRALPFPRPHARGSWCRHWELTEALFASLWAAPPGRSARARTATCTRRATR